MAKDTQAFDQLTLQNGLPVWGEQLSHFRTVSVGLWVRNGSVNEQVDNNGYSHMIEHMLFKGTAKRTARELAQEMDVLGGHMNAFTSKECTCYYIKVAHDALEKAVDLVADLALHATMPQEELEKEKKVITEEIAMVEDTPDDLVHELLCEAHFADHPLARTILGPASNVQAASRDDLMAFRKERYRPSSSVLSVAGRYDLGEVTQLAQKYFGDWEKREPLLDVHAQDTATRRVIVREKPIEQTHLCIGFPGISNGDEDVYAHSILNILFGGGMSSRLFQRIREENGMAYSVYSFPTAYSNCGMWTLYAGASPKNAQTVLDMMGEEIHRLLTDGVGQEEFDKAKEQIRVSYIMGQESTSSRMSSIGRAQLLLGRIQTEEQTLAKIAAATRDDAMRLANKLLRAPYSASCVGPKTDLDFTSIGRA